MKFCIQKILPRLDDFNKNNICSNISLYLSSGIDNIKANTILSFKNILSIPSEIKENLPSLIKDNVYTFINDVLLYEYYLDFGSKIKTLNVLKTIFVKISQEQKNNEMLSREKYIKKLNIKTSYIYLYLFIIVIILSSIIIVLSLYIIYILLWFFRKYQLNKLRLKLREFL
jgi:hypothetical protein